MSASVPPGTAPASAAEPSTPAGSTALARLEGVLRGMGRVAVAVSGGVDSLTLATVAGRLPGGDAVMFHAVSPAVPEAATRRTRALAAAEGWRLHVIDAGEFADAEYRANPANRCFFCKRSLYGAIVAGIGAALDSGIGAALDSGIGAARDAPDAQGPAGPVSIPIEAARLPAQIVSGTNLDDLGEYRPGLDAARERGVRHPFVEAGIDKAELRRIAAALGLGGIAELPAAPCLSSRVETGIRIEAAVLAAIDATERLVAAELAPRTVRCRVRAGAVVIELDEAALARLDPERQEGLRLRLRPLLDGAGVTAPMRFAAYRNGSAFLRPAG